MNGRTARHLRRLAERKHHEMGDFKPNRYVAVEVKRQPNTMAKLNHKRKLLVQRLQEAFGRATTTSLTPFESGSPDMIVPKVSATSQVLRVVGQRATYQELKKRYKAYRRGGELE